MAEDKLTILYNWLEDMTKAGDEVKNKYENEYKTIISYVKNSETKERILAAQLISRFFKHFPAYEETAFDSIVDLCESGDVDVRKHATMAMIAICRDSKHLVSKAADILIQLYQTDQASEVNLINQSLMTLLNLDIQKFLQSFFTNFEDGTEIVRERALKFLSTKIHTIAETSLTKEVEEQLLTYSKKAMEDVTKGEFITFIGILTKLKTAKTASGQSMIVSVIKSQAELNKDFDVGDSDSLDKFLLCTKHTIPLLSQYNRSSEYINYICLKVLPHLNSMAASGNDLNILQALAEMSPFVHLDDMPALIDLDKCQEEVYNKLVEYLPLPQAHDSSAKQATEAKATEAHDEASGKPAAENESATTTEAGQVAAETPASTTTATAAAAAKPTSESDTKKPAGEPDFQFTHIEYLIFTLHQFGKLKPELLTEARLNDLKPRLQNLHLGCTKYMEILSAQLRNVKSGEELKKEENKIRSVALRTTKNISTLVKDLFKRPPQFKTSVLLSCKPLTSRPIETNPSAGGNKQSNNNSNNNNNNNNNNNSSNNNNNNNNNNNRPPTSKGHHQNNAGYHHHRQAGQKYKQNYQGDRNKRARHAR